MQNRGIIKNAEYAKVLKDFSGLRYGRITPTDIDGYMEFGNKVFIFIESKYMDSPIPFGQNLALERLVDAVSEVRHAILIHCKHDESIVFKKTVNGKDTTYINYAECLVEQVRYKQKWIRGYKGMTLKNVIDRYLDSHNISNK